MRFAKLFEIDGRQVLAQAALNDDPDLTGEKALSFTALFDVGFMATSYTGGDLYDLTFTAIIDRVTEAQAARELQQMERMKP